jgi:hypothetical protein
MTQSGHSHYWPHVMKCERAIDIKSVLTNLALFGLLYQTNLACAQTGTMPIPQIDTARIETIIDTVKASGGKPTQYIYKYTVTNPISSKNSLYKLSFDISRPGRDGLHPTLQTVPKQGGAATRPYQEEVDFFVSYFFGRHGDGVVSIGLECPAGWNGGLRKDATAVCYSSNDAPEIGPGESMPGFVIHSRYPPMLREIVNTAFWTVVVDSLDEGIQEIDRGAAYEVLESLRRPQNILGPGYVLPFDERHFAMIEHDLAEMISMGWVPNTGLANDLSAIVADAGRLLEANDSAAAKVRLADVNAILENQSNDDIYPSAVTYLVVNIDSIDEFRR